MHVRPIPSQVFPKTLGAFPPLLGGEGRGEVVVQSNRALKKPTAGTNRFVPAAVFGRQLIRSLRTVPRKGHVAMMLTGLLHALWPVLPPSALISIIYSLPGVVGESVMRRALVKLPPFTHVTPLSRLYCS
jgi:hypothetical protein